MRTFPTTCVQSCTVSRVASHSAIGIAGHVALFMQPSNPVEQLPASIEALADVLMAGRGVEAVVLGGSRVSGHADGNSDWDLGVYYRGEVELDALATYGEVHPPGSWGRLMNGGAWLQLDGLKVDVLLRDLDAVEHWTAEAQEGRFEIDGLLGYVAGLPTYSLVAEAAAARPVRGELGIDGRFPERLAELGPARWRFNRDFSIRYAAMHAARGNVVGAVGQSARAIFEEAHARRCEQRRWGLNEKRLLDGCDLAAAAGLLCSPGTTNEELDALVTTLVTTLA